VQQNNLPAVFCIYAKMGNIKTTRKNSLWQSEFSSVKAIRYQTGDIYDALTHVTETAMDPKCRTEAQSLAKAGRVRSYKFTLTLVIWYDLLKQINVGSKPMQAKIPLSRFLSKLQVFPRV